MTTQIAYSEQFDKHDNINHPENAKRLHVMIEEIKKAPFYDDLDFIDFKMIPEKILYDVHTISMIEQIKDMSNLDDSWIDMDTYVCRSDYETARLATGGILKLSQNVLSGKAKNGFGVIRPPGHHATKNRSMGFCLFNNAAIVANEITKQNKKVLIFDLDVHHGNGTQDIFYNRNDVMYQSIHLYPHYPGTGGIEEIGFGEGKGYTLNSPLTHGNGNGAVSRVLDEIFLPVAEQFKPDLTIISAGFDSHHMDPLGGLKFTTNFFGEMIEKYEKIQPKIIGTLEGGYNLNWIGKCLVSILGKMSKKNVNFNDTANEHQNVDITIENIKEELKNYWEL